MTTKNQDRRVECWMRESVPAPIRRRQASVQDQLQKFEAAGTIEAVTVQTWDRAVYRPVDNGTGTSVGEKVTEFEQWAAEHGHDLQPGFTQRQHSHTDADRLIAEILLPIMCIAVYDGPTLHAIAPCSNDTRVYTVCDMLAALGEDDGDGEHPSPSLSLPLPRRKAAEGVGE